MAYSKSVRESIMKVPKSPGNLLGRWAINKNFSVVRIAKATGATRQTVYNWMLGGAVTQAYQERVMTVMEFLRTSNTAEEAWQRLCKYYNLTA